MSDDNFLERLRGEARQLRYEPDDFAFARLQARVRERIAPSATHFLVSWFRPLAAALAALSIAAALSTAYYVQSRDQVTLDSLASNSVEITVDGATYSVD